MAITETAIGRVVPNFRGEWLSSTIYRKLDNVVRNGDSYIAIVDNQNSDPAIDSNHEYWQLMASKGDSGRISGVVGYASASDNAYVAITTSGDPTDVGLTFNFGLPKGDTGDAAGFATAYASVNVLAWDSSAACRVTIDGPPTAAAISFDFDIPGANNTGISKVDNYAGTAGGNVSIYAVSYKMNQLEDLPGHASLSAADQDRARQNINAQIAGNYIADPSIKSTGQFLQFSNDGEWVATSINTVPNGQPIDNGKFLRKVNNGTIWADVQALPAGGLTGAPLIKRSNDDYQSTWGSITTDAEIDSIIDS